MSGQQVIVVGGGLAGHSAAHTVLEQGGRVLLIDKSAFCGGNSTKATSGINGGGTRFQRTLNIPDSAETFEQDTLKSAGTGARPHLIKALAHESGPAVEWLQDSFGLSLHLLGRLGAHSFPRTHRGTGKFPGMMITYRLIETLEEVASKEPSRARIITKARVTRLLKGPDGVSGVEYEQDGQLFTESGIVVIATGGFGADFSDQSLLQQVEGEWKSLAAWKGIQTPPLRSLPTTNGDHTTGDGIKLAVGAGANTVDLKYVQVHPTGLVDPKEPDSKVKWLAAEALRGCGALLLDAQGKRFADELGKRDYVSGRMWCSQAPFRLILNGAASREIEWHCKHYENRGVMKYFKTGKDLASEMSITVQQLADTFDKYNAAAKRGSDEFGKKFFNNAPFSVDDYFYVSVVTPVVHYTMGGIETNEEGQALGPSGPISGLYAAGEVIGGIHGNNRLGGSSLLDCVVYGRLSGRAASRELLSRALSAPPSVVSSDGNEIVEFDWGNKKVTVRPAGATAATSTVAAAQSVKSSPAAKSEPAAPKALKEFTLAEVAKHNTKTDCWVILNNQVYDVTPFLKDHPGGSASIVAFAGKDATEAFETFHEADILTKHGTPFLIGTVTASSGSVSLVKTQGSTSASGSGITMAEVAKHNTESDCWTVIHGKVYDVTSFLSDHPGGAAIMLKYAGKDSTASFDMAGHPKDIVTSLGLDHLYIGECSDAKATAAPTETHAGHEQSTEKPPLEHMLNLYDFEAVARACMTKQAWDYYSSGADDEVTLRENHTAFQRLWLRPRCLVDVSKIDLTGSMLGYKSSIPVYITATALGRLAHPEGEVVLTRAAHGQGVIQMCPTLASCTLEEMMEAKQPDQTQFFQLYVNHNREVTKRLVKRAEAGGIKALFVTVDAPQLGRREKDMRNKFTLQGTAVQSKDDKKGKVKRNEGTTRAISQFIDPSLSWKDIKWLQTITDLPIILKGIQCGEDAVKAVEYGCQGIVCSNHGGRQLDFARSGIEVLVEVMDALEKAGHKDKLEVYVDGGIRRGTDVMKAICLGAKAVGIGRPVLYGMAGYGQDGVEKVLEILRDEMIMGMRLIGAPSLAHLNKSMVCLGNLGDHITPVPRDNLARYVYEPLKTQSKL